MTSNENWITELKACDIKEIDIANGNSLRVIGEGKMTFENKGEIIELEDVLVVPDLKANLISVHQSIRKGCKFSFDKRGCIVTASNGKKIIATEENDGVYTISPKVITAYKATKGQTYILCNKMRISLSTKQ